MDLIAIVNRPFSSLEHVPVLGGVLGPMQNVHTAKAVFRVESDVGFSVVP